MKFEKWSLVAFSAAVVLLSNCKGDVGPAGTQGVAGATGQQGPAGSNGANGTNGATGQQGAAGTNGTNGTNGVDGQQGAAGTNGTNGTNAELAKVFITTVTSASWTSTTNGLQKAIAVPGITAEIETNGFVLVYVRNTSNTAWVSIANSVTSSIPNETRYFFMYSVGIVTVYYESSLTTTPTAPSDRAFKIVYMQGQAARMERSELEELYK